MKLAYNFQLVEVLLLPLLDDTSGKPAKSPVVDEVAFQEPSHVNNLSPEGKLVDGKEVPPAENGIWRFCVCKKMLSLTIASEICLILHTVNLEMNVVNHVRGCWHSKFTT